MAVGGHRERTQNLADEYRKKLKVLENVNPYTLLLALTSYAHPTYTLAQNVAEGYIEKLVI